MLWTLRAVHRSRSRACRFLSGFSAWVASIWGHLAGTKITMAPSFSFFGPRRSRFGRAVTLLLLLYAECLAGDRPVEKGELRELTSRRAFFQSGYGSVAVLPSVNSKEGAAGAGIFWLLKPYSLNTVKRRPDLWFQISHHLAESEGQPTHVGILLIKVVRAEHALPVTIYRNPNWTRQGEAQKLPALDRHLGLPWPEFTTALERWAAPTSEVTNSDAVIGGRWHARPSGGSALSWEYRRFWPLAVTNFQRTVSAATGQSFDPNRISVSAQLLRFVPTPLRYSDHPLVFKASVSDSDDLFLAIYLPGTGAGVDEISRWWWIRFPQ